jgi:hypothetical protein
MACRLCRSDRPLRNSHILPEFVYAAVYDEKHQFITLPLDGAGAEATHQKGLREPLLCDECEQALGKRERYASQLLFHKKGLKHFRQDATLFVPGVDYVGFRLFLLGLLWKMGESKRSEFHQVRLGPHSERLRQLLLAENPGRPHEYPCIIRAVRRHKAALRRTIVPPFKFRKSGHTAYRLSFAGFFWTFWLSSHISERFVGKSVLREDGILPIHFMPDDDVDRFMRSVALRIPDEPEA